MKHLIGLYLIKRVFVASCGALLVCMTLSANAQIQDPGPLIGLVEFYPRITDMTTQLLTAPLTTAQRQTLHAQNFSQFPPSARAYYLHAVAYGVGRAVASDDFNQEQGRALRQHFKDVIISSLNGEQGTMSIYTAPSIPPEYSQLLAAHMTLVKTVLQELNVKIADQAANNISYQQAMYAGAVYSFTISNLGSSGEGGIETIVGGTE